MTGDFPSEIAPVSAKLNALLQHQDQLIERARSRAGNFAHGLKTPLTIIEVLIDGLRDGGMAPVADGVREQTAAIGKLVDRELARSQLAAGHGQPVRDARNVLGEIINTMKHLPRGRDIAFSNDVAADQTLRIDRDDFIELFGNLLDNARKWAKASVAVTSERSGSEISLSVSDDGPGVEPGSVTAILGRGARLDEKAQGSGIGLAIVSDIAESYGLGLSFRPSAAGGLQVSVSFQDPKD